MRLSHEQVEQYHRDGFLVLEDLLSQTEVDALLQRVEDIAAGRIPFPEEGLEYEPGAKEHKRNIDSFAQDQQLRPARSLFPATCPQPRHTGGG